MYGEGDPDLFIWKTIYSTSQNTRSSSSFAKSPVCIFVAHDNPQLSKTVTERITPSHGSFKGKSGLGMQIMLEAKGKNDLTHFLIGDIIYSGDYCHVQDASLENSRGSECLIATNLKAVRHPIKQFQTRNSPTNKDIVEINMVDLPPSSIVDVSSTEGVTDFLSSCKARVDCILDPYQSQHTWYPYYEGNGGRKMAPQFRSQGIGYIRLGDDMSNFGIAFISLDAGATYLDNGATSIVDTRYGGSLSPSPYGFASSPNLRSLVVTEESHSEFSTPVKAKASRRNIRNVVKDARTQSLDTDDHHSKEPPTTEPNSLSISTQSRNSGAAAPAPPSPLVLTPSAVRHNPVPHLPKADKIQEVLTSLKDGAIKWQQRTQLLNALCSLLDTISKFYLSGSSGSSSSSASSSVEAYLTKNSSLTTDLLSVLLDHLLKQKNPLTVVATLGCVGCLSFGELLAAHFGVFWRSLLVESLHLLRSNNKQVYEAAQGTANSLYQLRAISFAYLSSGLMGDILAGPKSGNSSSANSATSTPTNNNKKPMASGAALTAGGANISRVVAWLEDAISIDLDASIKCIVALEMVSRTGESAHNVDMTPLAGAAAFKTNVSPVLRKLTALLTHREETTRENAISLITCYFTLFILYNYSHVSSFTGMSQILSQTVEQEETTAPFRSELLYRVLQEDTLVEVLQEMEKVSQRAYEKIIPSIYALVIATGQAMSRLLEDSLAVGQSSSSKEGGEDSSQQQPEINSSISGSTSTKAASVSEPVTPPVMKKQLSSSIFFPDTHMAEDSEAITISRSTTATKPNTSEGHMELPRTGSNGHLDMHASLGLLRANRSKGNSRNSSRNSRRGAGGGGSHSGLNTARSGVDDEGNPVNPVSDGDGNGEGLTGSMGQMLESLSMPQTVRSPIDSDMMLTHPNSTSSSAQGSFNGNHHIAQHLDGPPVHPGSSGNGSLLPGKMNIHQRLLSGGSGNYNSGGIGGSSNGRSRSGSASSDHYVSNGSLGCASPRANLQEAIARDRAFNRAVDDDAVREDEDQEEQMFGEGVIVEEEDDTEPAVGTIGLPKPFPTLS